ncbi:DNA primase [Fructobacillus pseudoficulneus]|uniref:DNA primase n=1 Tax=Fructobacillus pseudoficulneus TaxID=220714 RepID=A0A3F3GT00_9LACO|nr:DNA primase [Fructobacillus pseudoficulneus]GAP02671.1 DNA primase [Fructobacillus pseudoficulneus]SEH38970.1 DNA primase [Fructobacillus pseudoficulneus]
MAERIPQSVIDEVRSQTNLVDLIQNYTQLVKRGREWNGSCPFHEDRRPSLFVDDKKQVFHCFSCGRSGTAFSFLMEKEGYTYPQAVLSLAKDLNISGLDKYEGQLSARQEKYAGIFDLYSNAERLYTHILLNTTAGEQALEYLHNDRQLDDETIKRYGLGFVPSNNVLLSYAREHNLDEGLLKQSQLFLEQDDEISRDRFNNRVVWPIKDDRGQVRGFSGRSLDPDNPAKYMNSPESPFFNKGHLLYNFDQAKGSIRAGQPAMIFEGFMDVISAALAGAEGAVATMGTALTDAHVKELAKITDRILLIYDGDAAGQKAAKRSIPLIRQVAPQIEIGVITLPDGRDPDEIRRERGLDALKQALDHSVLTPTEFLIQAAKNGKNLQNQAQYLEFLKEAWPILTDASPVEQDYFLKQFSDEYGSDYAALKAELQQYQTSHARTEKKPVAAKKANRSGFGSKQMDWQEPAWDQDDGGNFDSLNQMASAGAGYSSSSDIASHLDEGISQVERAEQGLLMAMIKAPGILAYVKGLPDFAFVHPEYQLLMMLFEAYQQQAGQGFDLAGFMDFVQKPDLNQKMMAIDREFGTLEVQRDAVDDYLRIIMKEAPYQTQVENLKKKMALAMSQHDDTALIQLTTELVNLRKQHAQ